MHRLITYVHPTLLPRRVFIISHVHANMKNDSYITITSTGMHHYKNLN
jgi:hypothetical protein